MLTELQIVNNSTDIIELLLGCNRNNMSKVLSWLEDNGLFTSPASRKYHGSYDGGLAEHSLNVYKRLLNLDFIMDKKLDPNSLKIVALLHDVCKVGMYEKDFESVQEFPDIIGSNSRIVKYKGYKYTNRQMLGHGEASVIKLLELGLELSLEEQLAIRYHMGMFDTGTKNDCMQYNLALKKSPLVLLLHHADMMASYFDEGDN